MPDSFLIQMDESPSLCRLNVGGLTMAAQASASDQLYVGDATGFAEFAISTVPVPYLWKSADFLYPRPENFSAGVVDALGVGTARIYADGVLREEVSFNGNTYFRLRAGPPAYRWAVELEGVATVRKVDLARSFGQLKGL